MFSFEPEGIAYLDAESWRAYYDRQWVRLLQLLVKLNQEQFHIPFPLSKDGPSYAFTSNWDVSAPIQVVWDAIYDSEQWPRWWPYVAAVEELAPGNAQGVDAVRRYTWTTRLPYRLVFDSRLTKVEAPHLLEASAYGQLNGVGRWTLSSTGETTHVRYDWNVSTSLKWMNLMAPIARPLFAWNHDAVMRSGAEGLGRLLHVPVRVQS